MSFDSNDADMPGPLPDVGFTDLADASAQECWERLSLQLSAYNNVIAIAAIEYDNWPHDFKIALLQIMMETTGYQDVRFVRDSGGPRVFLGAVEHLTNANITVVEMPGYDLPVTLLRSNLWNADNQQQQQQPALQYGAPPPFPMPGQSEDAVAPEHETPTKRSSARKRKAATTKTPGSNKRGTGSARNNKKDGPGAGGINVNLARLPQPDFGRAIDGANAGD
ncbi:hypothetical protein JX266_002742 [Neoarthrinium moseri]|nr:hypothetical protein JX266_002742 [Neoarthrinium moseri]